MTFVSSVKSLVKIADKAVGVVKYVPQNDPIHLLKATEAISFLNSVCSIHSAVVSAETMYKNIKQRKNLTGLDKVINDAEIVSSGLGVANGFTAPIKLVDQLHQWAKAGASMGSTAISTTSAFGTASSAFSILILTIEIGIAFLRLYNLEKKVTRTKDKVNFWQQATIDAPFIQNRVTRIQSKVAKLQPLINAAQKKLADMYPSTATSQAKMERKLELLKQKQGITKPLAWVSYKWSKSFHKYNLSKQTRYKNALDPLNQKQLANRTKIEEWTNLSKKIENLTDQDRTEIQQFQLNKQAKWGIKKSNLRLDQWKTVLTIALKIAVLAVLITSFALTVSGVGTLPAMLTLASLSLAFAVVGFGLEWYKELRKPKPIQHVKIPQLAAAAA